VRTLGGVKGKVGEVIAIGDDSIRVTAQGGQIEIFKVKPEGGKKVSAVEFAQGGGVSVGTILGG
jgi:methionyl-tRNA formyltransferase